MGILKRFSGFGNLISFADRSSAEQAPFCEPLESRRLLSASLAGGITVNPGGPIVPSPPISVGSLKTFGVTVHVKAGQSFDGYLGGLSGVQNAAPDFRNLRASIDWGDGSDLAPVSSPPAPNRGTLTSPASTPG